jgi:hypothetical protein
MPNNIQQLLIGPTYTLSSTLIYAMPPRTVNGWVSSTTMSANSIASTTGAVAITVTGGQFISSAPFLVPGATATIRLTAA